MSDYPMLISNKLHSFRNFCLQIYENYSEITPKQVKVSFNNGVNLWIPISFK